MGMMKGNSFKEGYQKLKIGMDKEDVIELFGAPNSQKVKEGVETFTCFFLT